MAYNYNKNRNVIKEGSESRSLYKVPMNANLFGGFFWIAL